ncbi:protein shisa-9B-like isoform X1 [Seriola lalandi dorsalis]|uniref:Shisa family member 9b n=1 Tax=Seriola dumerili TaxID=41447 RepID=A0A3B4V6I2_SERDU|nr:protein shisa-9B-like isoform X1 [Seriola dumerili]XP_023269545.1 protein shisa-9B-like isoform X1 [Seriola lalandi dorsalis]XP_056258287.1 protein shisa-9B isoform X1 [Seriola aureovittata]
MRGTELLLGYFLVKVMVCDAEGEPGQTVDDFIIVTGFNDSKEGESRVTENPHMEDKCRGYYDVMGQWDPPFVCRTGSYLYCCGTCGFRFCCAFKSSRLDQTTCKNYDTPPWMMTGKPPPKVDVALDTAKDKTNLIVYVICGVVAIMALIGIFTKLGLEKTHRPHRENMSRALAHVIRHPATEHTDDIGLGQHYENIQTRVTVNSLHSNQMNNVVQTSTLITQPYPAVGQITSPYEQQKPVKDLNKYATLKAVAEKANDSFYSNRRQVIEMTTKGSLPMEAVDMEPEPSNPYSPPRQLSTKQNGHKYKSPKSHSSQTLCYGSSSAASPGVLRSWESKETSGPRQSYGPKKLCIVEKELHTTRYMLPQPYFVTNSKTEVTV